ncbi:hypothetical protein [Phenylobacterium sp.]|uniref:hypothetical protein n=1 Tax=Phenylobacterium sp. TaxID=1871053 RepID=UPI0025F6FCF3|nr:hypothetical protein [Phenylobacterium sp.]
MLISAVAALALFAAPETTQSGEAVAAEKPAKSAKAEEKGPTKMCYTATPSGSRMPRKVCVTKAADSAKDAEKGEAAKPE